MEPLPQKLRDGVDAVVDAAASVPGWTQPEDARAIAMASLELPDDPVLVEVGVFMGRCTVLLAGARRVRGSGTVHCVDPFDCSGDAFSIGHYRELLEAEEGRTLEEAFRRHVASCGLSDWIEVHAAPSAEVAGGWSRPVDLLLLDGDQSPEGARQAWEGWTPFLKPGGTVILRNTRDRTYAEGHDGHRRLAVGEVVPPRFSNIRQVGATTVARFDPPASP